MYVFDISLCAQYEISTYQPIREIVWHLCLTINNLNIRETRARVCRFVKVKIIVCLCAPTMRGMSCVVLMHILNVYLVNKNSRNQFL